MHATPGNTAAARTVRTRQAPRPGTARDINGPCSYRATPGAAVAASDTLAEIPVSLRGQAGRLTLTIAPAPRSRRAPARVDAGGTRLRLRALHVMGHGSARIGRAVGASEKTIRALVCGDARTVGVRLRDRIAAVYDIWWDKRAPERTRAERSAATAARRRAIRGNWCAAAALDDDQLDVPGYRPAYGWRPAHGTGYAPDITPQVTGRRRVGRSREPRP